MIFLALAVSLAALLVAMALVTPNCARCGEPYDHPVHFGCVSRRCAGGHHLYRASSRPSFVVLVMLVLSLVAYLVTR